MKRENKIESTVNDLDTYLSEIQNKKIKEKRERKQKTPSNNKQDF